MGYVRWLPKAIDGGPRTSLAVRDHKSTRKSIATNDISALPVRLNATWLESRRSGSLLVLWKRVTLCRADQPKELLDLHFFLRPLNRLMLTALMVDWLSSESVSCPCLVASICERFGSETEDCDRCLR